MQSNFPDRLRTSTTKRVVVSPPFWLAKYQALARCRAINKNYFVLIANVIKPIQSLHLGQY